jgi:hypothetical protein
MASAGKQRLWLKWHGSCGLRKWFAASYFARAYGREVLMQGARNKSEYDLNSAITFLLVGLGIGSVLSIVFNPKQRVAPEEVNRWRMSELRPETEAEERVA